MSFFPMTLISHLMCTTSLSERRSRGQISLLATNGPEGQQPCWTASYPCWGEKADAPDNSRLKLRNLYPNVRANANYFVYKGEWLDSMFGALI